MGDTVTKKNSQNFDKHQHRANIVIKTATIVLIAHQCY